MENSRNKKAYSLIGIDGNAYSVMGYVANALKRNGHTQDEVNAYFEDAKSADYNHLLCVSVDVIEMINKENGFEEGKQFDKPQLDAEWESCSCKKDARKINESDLDSIANDLLKYDKEKEEEKKEVKRIPKDVKKVFHYALADALIKLWDDFGMEYTKSEAKYWMEDAVNNFDWESFSLNSYLEESLQPINEDEDADNINIQLDYEPMKVQRKQISDKLHHSFYITAEDLKNCGLSIEDFVEANKKALLDMYIVNDKDLQIMFNTYERYKLDKTLMDIKELGTCTFTDLQKFIEKY